WRRRQRRRRRPRRPLKFSREAEPSAPPRARSPTFSSIAVADGRFLSYVLLNRSQERAEQTGEHLIQSGRGARPDEATATGRIIEPHGSTQVQVLTPARQTPRHDDEPRYGRGR